MSESTQQATRISPYRTSGKVRNLAADELLADSYTPLNDGRKLPLQHLAIEGLLSFGEKTHFEFGALNIVVGPNGSGKSNLIDCIRILHNTYLDIQETFRISGFEDWIYKGASKQLSYASLEMTANIPGIAEKVIHQLRLSLHSTSRVVLEEVISSGEEQVQKEDYFVGSYRSGATLNAIGSNKRRRNRSLSGANYNPFASILSQIRDAGQYPEITRLGELYSKFHIYSEWSFGRSSTLRESTLANGNSTSLSELMDNLPLVLNRLQGTPAQDNIRLQLRELKETYLDYITRNIFGRMNVEIEESPFDSPVPAQRLSDGTLRFLALAAILLHPEPPPLICLEEPELGMHPDMITMVAKMIVDASKQTQVIVTTHSEHLLTALQGDFDVIFGFDTGRQGSVVNTLLRQEYVEWRADHNLGELWSSGEIGGVRY